MVVVLSQRYYGNAIFLLLGSYLALQYKELVSCS